MACHDRVLAYGQTYDGSTKPLVLVVGREPSFDADTIEDSLGQYDFDIVTSSSFWNVAHRYLAIAAGESDKALKDRCRTAQRSPLVIGDALPIGVENGNRAVSQSRAEVSYAEIDMHVERTLALSEAEECVRLVVLAGHLTGKRGAKKARENLAYASASYRRQAETLGDGRITVVNIPFLSDLNSKVLRQVLSEGSTPGILQGVFTEFFNGRTY